MPFSPWSLSEVEWAFFSWQEETPSVRALATAPLLRDISTVIPFVELSFRAAFGRGGLEDASSSYKTQISYMLMG